MLLIIGNRGINRLFIMFPHITRNNRSVRFIKNITNLMPVWPWLAWCGLVINGLGHRVPSSYHRFLVINCKRDLIMPTTTTFMASTTTFINTNSSIIIMTEMYSVNPPSWRVGEGNSNEIASYKPLKILHKRD